MERHPTKKQTTTTTKLKNPVIIKQNKQKLKREKKTVENFMEMRLEKLKESPLPKHTHKNTPWKTNETPRKRPPKSRKQTKTKIRKK